MSVLGAACVEANLATDEFLCDQRGGDAWLVDNGRLHDDYLTIDEVKLSVNWYKATGSVPLASYVLRAAPLRAVFCGVSLSSSIVNDFQGSELAVAILTSSNMIHICLSSGEQHDFMVPFGVKHLISTPEGLLLEKVDSNGVTDDDHVVSYSYLCLRSVYEPLSTVELKQQNGNSIDKSYRIQRAHHSLLCMTSELLGKMALVHVVATKKKKPTFVDHHQMVNLSLMSGFMSVDRSNISETSSKSLERFRSDNNHSRLSNGSGGGGGSSSGPGTAPTRIINVGLTRQRSLPRSSPSPTNVRVGGGRASSPFADTAVGVSQYAGNNTLHSLLGVQQFTSATNRHFRENNNRSQEGRGTGKVTTTRSSPRASAAEGEDDNDAEETEEDLLDFDFLHANTESHDIILGETCVGLLWCGGLDMETHDFSALQVVFARRPSAAGSPSSSSSSVSSSLYFYVITTPSCLQLFRLVQGGNGSEEMEMVKVHAWNDVFPISSMAVVHVAHVHDNPHAMSVPMVICGGSQGIQVCSFVRSFSVSPLCVSWRWVSSLMR
jgi:hypothetical protein